MSLCKVCKEQIVEGDKRVVTCVICNEKLHAHYSTNNSTKNCAEINASENKLVEMTKPYHFIYRCNQCSNTTGIIPKLDKYLDEFNSNMRRINDFKQNMALLPEILKELQAINKIKMPSIIKDIKDINEILTPLSKTTIPAIENRLKNLEEARSNVNTEANEENLTIQVIREINERTYKQKNVIFYNIPESPNNSNDKSLVEKIINNPTITKNINFISRIGIYSAESIRPLRVKTKYIEDAAWIISNSLKIKENSKKAIVEVITNIDVNKLSSVTMSNDRTKMEILLYKKVKAELNQRKKDGEMNIKIGTINGIPAIKKIIPKNTETTQKNS